MLSCKQVRPTSFWRLGSQQQPVGRNTQPPEGHFPCGSWVLYLAVLVRSKQRAIAWQSQRSSRWTHLRRVFNLIQMQTQFDSNTNSIWFKHNFNLIQIEFLFDSNWRWKAVGLWGHCAWVGVRFYAKGCEKWLKVGNGVCIKACRFGKTRLCSWAVLMLLMQGVLLWVQFLHS